MKFIIALIDWLSGPSGSENDRYYDLTSERNDPLPLALRKIVSTTDPGMSPVAAADVWCRSFITAPHLLTGTRGVKAVQTRRRAERREERTRIVNIAVVPPVTVLANRRQKV